MKKKIFIYFVIFITVINLTSLGVILYHRSTLSSSPIKMEEQEVFEQVKREVKLTPVQIKQLDRKSTRLNSSHIPLSRMPSSA